MVKFVWALILLAGVAYSLPMVEEIPDACEEESKLPHPDCTKYYECVNGDLIVRDCALTTYFNPRILECDFPSQVPECQGGTRPPEGSTTAPTTTTPQVNSTTTASPTTTPPPVNSTTVPPTTTSPVNSTTVPPTTTSPVNSTTVPPTTTSPVNSTTVPPTTTSPVNSTTVPPTTTSPVNSTTVPPTTTSPVNTTTTTTTAEPSTTSEPEEPITTDETTDNIDSTTVRSICAEDGIYFETDPSNCSNFYICVNSNPEGVMTCPEGTFFDPSVCACNLADLVKGCAEPICKDGEVKFKPIPDDCSAYIVCVNGNSTIAHCPPDLLFDPVLLICNRKEVVKCEESSEETDLISPFDRAGETCYPSAFLENYYH